MSDTLIKHALDDCRAAKAAADDSRTAFADYLDSGPDRTGRVTLIRHNLAMAIDSLNRAEKHLARLWEQTGGDNA